MGPGLASLNPQARDPSVGLSVVEDQRQVHLASDVEAVDGDRRAAGDPPVASTVETTHVDAVIAVRQDQKVRDWDLKVGFLSDLVKETI